MTTTPSSHVDSSKYLIFIQENKILPLFNYPPRVLIKPVPQTVSPSFATNLLYQDGLPLNVTDTALIKNPSNENEVFLFGGFREKRIFVYNTISNQFKQIKNDFSKVMDDDVTLEGVRAVKGLTENSIITLGSPREAESYPVLSIFNTKSFKWCNVNGKEHGFTSRDLPFCGACMIRFEQYLIFTGGTWSEPHNIVICKVDIIDHDINSDSDSYKIEVIKLIRASSLNNFAYHMMVRIDNIRMYTGDDDDDIKQGAINRIKLLIFGGHGSSFVTSFRKISIDFDALEYGTTSTSSSGSDTVEVEDYDSGNKKLKGITVEILATSKKIEQVQLQVNDDNDDDKDDKDENVGVGDNGDGDAGDAGDADDGDDGGCSDAFTWNNLSKDISKIPEQIKHGFFVYGSCHLVNNNKYLIMIGGHGRNVSDCIIYLNLQTFEWNIFKYKLPFAIYGQSSIICHYSNQNSDINGINKITTRIPVLHVMGGCYDSKSFASCNLHWKFKLTRNADWNMERQIWIAFYQNNQTHHCFLSQLPKDVILLILKFFRNKSIFDDDQDAL